MFSSSSNRCYRTLVRRDSSETDSPVLVFLNVHVADARIDTAHGVSAKHANVAEQMLLLREPAEAPHEDHLASERNFFETTQRNAQFPERSLDGLESSANEIPPQIHLLVACERIELGIPQRAEERLPLGIHLRDGERIARKENVRFATLVQRLLAERHVREQSVALSAEVGSTIMAYLFETEEVIAHNCARGTLVGSIHMRYDGFDIGSNAGCKSPIAANPCQIVCADTLLPESTEHGTNPVGFCGPLWTASRRTGHGHLLSLRAIEESAKNTQKGGLLEL